MIKKTTSKIITRIKEHRTVLPSFATFFVLLLVGGIVSPGYVSADNIIVLLILAAPLGIMSIGQTLVILSGSGDLDLSAGANASLAIVLAALLLQQYPLELVTPVVMLIGLGFGALNGVGTRIGNIPPLIMTFGTAGLLVGIGTASTKGMTKGMSTPLLEKIAIGRLAGIPVSVMIWTGLTIITIYLLNRTTYGRCLYASGANPVAAHLSGISNTIVGIVAYALSGASSAFAGLLWLGRLEIPSGFNLAGDYTLPCIAAVVLGGTIWGGGGGYTGTIGGVLTFTILGSFFSIFDISIAGRIVMNGLTLIIILMFYARREKLRE